MKEIPLFPLGSVLFPHGQMPLQIFEQRYLDLVRDSMREASGFGVVLITEGRETVSPGSGGPVLAGCGCYARIIDFDQLPNGLLGVTIAGGERFTLERSRVADSGLVMGRVELEAPLEAEPMQPQWDGLRDVLHSLQSHPHVQRMQLKVDEDDAWQVGFTLAQLLPLREDEKLQLLQAASAADLMAALDDLLGELGGDD